MKFLSSKKGNLEEIRGLVVAFIIAALVIAIGASIVTTVQTTAGSTNGSIQGGNAAYNVTGAGAGGLTQMSSYLPILGLVLIASIVIGVLVTVFRA